MNVYDVLKWYMEANGYDGLYNNIQECSCDIKSLCNCGGFDSDCFFGYQVVCDDCEGKEECADYDSVYDYIVRHTKCWKGVRK